MFTTSENKHVPIVNWILAERKNAPFMNSCDFFSPSYLDINFILLVFRDEFLRFVQVAVGEEYFVESGIPLSIDELHEFIHRHHLRLAFTPTAGKKNGCKSQQSRRGMRMIIGSNVGYQGS